MAVVQLMLARALRDHLRRRARVLLLEVDHEFRLVRALGEARHYGLAQLQALELLPERLPFLLGLNPRQTHDLRFVEVRAGVVADIHIVPEAVNTWVLFFDVLEAYERERKLQQRANETQLLNSKLKAMLGELRSTQAELQRSSEELRQANASKARLIASFSHELRTPLTAILGFASHLKPRFSSDPTAQRGLAAVERGGEHLLMLIDNLLDSSVLELGQLTVQPVAIVTVDLFSGVIDLMRPLAEKRALRLTLTLASLLPAVVQLDANRVRQILINLLSNAIKFTDRGGVEVAVSYDDDTILIAVRDTGTGIPASARAKLFEPFVRGSHANAHGTGLGLSISRGLAVAHGGSLELLDGGPGNVFELRIPAPPTVPPAAVDDRRVRRAERTIMICDDDSDVQALIGLVLGDAGYVVANGDRGDALVARCREVAPAVLLLDLNLGQLNGFDCLEALRASALQVPVIAISADTRSVTAEQVGAAGFDDFVHKPIKFERLIQAVDQLSGVL